MAPIQTVGIIGAGVSGVAAAVHLKQAGLQVTVFERGAVPGGVWVFDERRPPEPPFPSINASEADFTFGELPLRPKSKGEAELWHAPPGPCYEGLKNNVPTSLLEMSINSWKSGTEEIVTHDVLKDYIQDTAAKYNINASTLYGTRAEHVVREGHKWIVQTTTLTSEESGKARRLSRTWKFDYLIVATGHYHAERVPDVPGLQEWKELWPDRVQHSKSYRSAKEFANKSVLIVGAGTSSTDIAKEIGPIAKRVYQSSRGGLFDLPHEMLPPEAVRIPGIASFNLNSYTTSPMPVSGVDPIPNSVTLVTGEELHNIDHVILATGYHCAFPFLRHLHRDDIPPENADEKCLVTDGTQVHNLYHDIFYIPEPSLAIIGVPYFSATFSLFEFQAIAVARIFSGQADLPSEAEMRTDYEKRIMAKGVGKAFHSLLGDGREIEYVNFLVQLVNRGVNGEGLAKERRMTGHTEKWLRARHAFEAAIKARRGMIKASAR